MPARLLAATFAALCAFAAQTASADEPRPTSAPLPALPQIPTPAEPPPLPDLPSVPEKQEKAERPREVVAPLPPPSTEVGKSAPAPAAEPASLAGAGAPGWPGWLLTSQGTLGGLSLPTLATPGQGRAAVSGAVDYHRGGNFLFPGATSQRAGWSLAGSYGALSWLETFGSLWFHSTNLFAQSGRRTLGSYGDLAAGVKASLPRRGPLSGGALLSLDVPSGVGGFSLKGTGGRAAMLAGYTDRFGNLPLSITALAGYRIDNSGRLERGALTTFATYALALSRYDRVEAGLSLAMPFARVTPAVELELFAPVARQTPLSAGGNALQSRLTLGAQALTPVQGLALQGGVRISLSRQGRLSDLSLPLEGFAPDAPWQVFLGAAYSFEPHLPRLPSWSREKQPEFARATPEPAAPSVRAAPVRAKVSVLATDARTHLPVGGAWIAWTEGTDPGAVTAPDGTARLEHDPGAATVAVAHEKYELFTELLFFAAGEEKQLSVTLTPNAADATVRGRIVGEDAVPLRAALLLVGPGNRVVEPRWFEGSFTLSVPHGPYTLQAATPGFRAEAVRLEVRPGETITQDIVLRRLAGEPTARATPRGIELSRPVPFVAGKSALFPVAFSVLAEVAEVLKREERSFTVELRVEQEDLPAGTDADAQAQLLSAERARSITEFLQDKGVRKGQLTPRGAGLSKAGQLQLELTPVEAEPRPPRSEAAPAEAPSRIIAVGGRP